MAHSTKAEFGRLGALAREMADSLSAVPDEVGVPRDWRLRVAAGHAHTLEDLLRDMGCVAREACDRDDAPGDDAGDPSPLPRAGEAR